MGGSLSCASRNPARVILLGLDAAGKTTILYKFLRAHQSIDTFPTVGFNVERITFRHLTMMVWDFGGQMIVRNLRKQSFEDYDAIIFVIDSSDRKSFQEAKEELWTFLSFAPDMMDHTVLLIMANKQDRKEAAKAEELEKFFELDKLPRTAQYKIQATCAVNGNGLIDSLEWLTATIKENQRKNVTATYL